ncbi:hypothetical protein DSCO28_70430 [Desulfosarcina ovata subsp. sediminis]|uniref:Uncharacterized protein n=2 Tax=Desulfosarcina ovata TaxID=83564 RepID=A0A5K8AL27_9BACT|nr:hypothetical protein DSCO28_70430 [Desulfosarcina ovata subsp. sediminis]BBO93401.1 hypothetical protein DSCOOX_65810 [Desulfosarcina ovata subsp. ovata]
MAMWRSPWVGLEFTGTQKTYSFQAGLAVAGETRSMNEKIIYIVQNKLESVMSFLLRV